MLTMAPPAPRFYYKLTNPGVDSNRAEPTMSAQATKPAHRAMVVGPLACASWYRQRPLGWKQLRHLLDADEWRETEDANHISKQVVRPC